MAINYPTSKDDSTTLPNPSASDDRNSPSLAGLNDNQNSAVIALESKLGITASTPASGMLLRSTADGESTWDLAYPGSTIVGISDTQTLTNKTLTSPTINGATISNPTLDVDAVVGYTTTDDGTVYGMSVSGGILASAAIAGQVNTAAIQSAAVTPDKLGRTVAAGAGTQITSATTYVVTGLGFNPRVIEITAIYTQASATSHQFVLSIGTYDRIAGTQFSMGGAAGDTYGASRIDSSNILNVTNALSSSTIVAVGAISATSSDGFTLTVATYVAAVDWQWKAWA